MKQRPPAEGDLYKTLTVAGHSFRIHYGYYADEDRMHQEPMPIFPCLEQEPLYTEDGFPLVTCIQDACAHYAVHTDEPGNGWCCDCVFYSDAKDEIGICQCANNRNLSQCADTISFC